MMNYILFGAGKRTKEYIETYGTEQITAIVDNNYLMLTEGISDIPIQNPDIIIEKRYSECTVIICVENEKFAVEIADKWKSGIRNLTICF